MLMSVTVTANTKSSFDVGTRLIRAEAAYAAVVSGTGCELDYPMNDRDRRESLTHLTISETQANVVTAMDLAYNAVSIALLVHPDNNTSLSTVSTVFSAGDIVYGKPYTPDAANKSWIYIQKGAFKVVKYLVDYTLAEVISLAETGAP